MHTNCWDTYTFEAFQSNTVTTKTPKEGVNVESGKLEATKVGELVNGREAAMERKLIFARLDFFFFGTSRDRITVSCSCLALQSKPEVKSSSGLKGQI